MVETTLVGEAVLDFGNDTEVVFKDGDVFNSSADFTFNKTSKVLALAGFLAIASGTLTASAPAIATTQTWDNVAVTFVGADMNITDTASAITSNLQQWRVNGAIIAYLRIDGKLVSGALDCGNGSLVGGSLLFSSAKDVILLKDGAANTLALRNGTNAQTARVYGTFTDASNNSRLELYSDPTGYSSIHNTAAGTGTFGAMFMVANALRFQTGASYAARTARWQISSSGHFLAETDNTYDIGASGATRPRNIYAGTNILASDIYASNSFQITSKIGFLSGSAGVLTLTDNTFTNFGRLTFGGTTSSFPALKRNGAQIQVRLADDSGLAELLCLLPTSDPGVSGALWNNAGTPAISA